MAGRKANINQTVDVGPREVRDLWLLAVRSGRDSDMSHWARQGRYAMPLYMDIHHKITASLRSRKSTVHGQSNFACAEHGCHSLKPSAAGANGKRPDPGLSVGRRDHHGDDPLTKPVSHDRMARFVDCHCRVRVRFRRRQRHQHCGLSNCHAGQAPSPAVRPRASSRSPRPKSRFRSEITPQRTDEEDRAARTQARAGRPWRVEHCRQDRGTGHLQDSPHQAPTAGPRFGSTASY